MKSVAALSLVALILAGCGGSHGTSVSRRAGRSTLKILWPVRGRLIPAAANSLVVTLSRNGTTVDQKTIARPTGNATETSTDFGNLPVATFNLDIKAYPNSDGTGVVQATGSGTMTTAVDNPGSVTISLGSTVSTLTLAPSATRLTAGGTATLVASAKDSGGNVVLLSAGGGSEPLNWTSSNSSIVSVTGSGSTATATGVSNGDATIYASLTTTDAGANVSAGTSLTTWDGVTSGTILWSYLSVGNVVGGTALAPNGTIYFGASDAKIYAVNPDGTLKWSYTTGNSISATPTVATDGTVYSGSTDGYLYALNPDGTLKWRTFLNGNITAKPAIGSDGTIYLGIVSNRMYAVNPDGTIKWSYSATGQIQTLAAIGSDGTIYFTTYSGYLYALSPSGSLVWRYLGPYIIRSAATIGKDGNIAFADYGGNVNVVTSSGSLSSSTSCGGSFTGGMAVLSNGNFVAASSDGHVYCVDPQGNLKWTAGGSIGSAQVTPGLSVNDDVYVGTITGKFLCIDINGNVRWTLDTGAQIKSFASVAVDGTVYFGTTGGIRAVH